MAIVEGSPEPRVADGNRGMSLGTLGMVLILVSIGAFFIALAAAYFFAIQDRPALTAAHFGGWFWASTCLILLSSVTLQVARRSLRFARLHAYRRQLQWTLLIGVLFLCTQLLGCLDLARQGVFLVGNPHGSVYFIFSGVHAFHLIGGLGGLWWLLRRARRLADGEEQPLRKHRSVARNVSIYWHFMGILWVGLFVLLLVWS